MTDFVIWKKRKNKKTSTSEFTKPSFPFSFHLFNPEFYSTNCVRKVNFAFCVQNLLSKSKFQQTICFGSTSKEIQLYPSHNIISILRFVSQEYCLVYIIHYNTLYIFQAGHEPIHLKTPRDRFLYNGMMYGSLVGLALSFAYLYKIAKPKKN